MDHIQIIQNKKVTRTIEVKIGDLTIGRDSNNDIVLMDTKVSRQHARLSYDGIQYLITDLHSTNGTFLDETQLLADVPEKWSPNKFVRVGSFFLRLVPEEKTRRHHGAEEVVSSPATNHIKTSALSGRVGIYLPQPELRVDAGSSISTNVVLLNEGSLVDHFRVTVEGVPPEWVSLGSQEVQLMPGIQGKIRLEVSPPRSPQSLAGIHPLKIKVSSQVSPDEFVEGKLVLEITPFYQFTSNLRPQKYRGLKSGNFTIEIRNLGNVETTFELEAADPEDICNFKFRPTPAVIPAGHEGKVSLRIDSKIPFSGEVPKIYTFTITAHPGESPQMTREIRGEWEQAYPSLEMRLQPARKRGVAEGTYQVLLRNQSHEDLTIQLEAGDLEEACSFIFETSQPNVQALQERSVRLVVKPNTALTTQEAITYPFHVTAQLTEAASVQQQVQGEWVQLPPNFDIALNPQKLKGRSQGSYRLNLRNLSASELTFRLHASDEESGCRYNFSAPELRVPDSQEKSCEFTVQPKKRLKGEETKIHHFTITAQPVVAPALSKGVEGEWEQIPGMLIGKTSILRYLLALLMVLLGWGLALRPFLIFPEVLFCWECYFDMAFQLGVQNVWDIDLIPPLIGAILTGFIGGAITGIALKIGEPSLSLKNIISITLGWLAAAVIAFLIPLLIASMDIMIMESLSGWLVNNLLFSLIGGFFTARALQKTELSINTGYAILLILGWMLAWFTVFLALNSGMIENPFSLGAIFGLVGGGITILTIYRLRSQMA
jgi:hypothetical protein